MCFSTVLAKYGHQGAWLAPLMEHTTLDPGAVGSIPSHKEMSGIDWPPEHCQERDDMLNV